jgi:LCP family protein required for cell wall assembly
MAQPSRPHRRRTATKGKPLPLWAITLGFVLALAFLLVSSIWLFRTVQAVASEWNATAPDFGDVAEPGPSTTGDNGQTAGDGGPGDEAQQAGETQQRWSGRERVTILLLGIDQRCDEEGPTRTDTMMVVTLDPVGLSAATLSLPRDLWVEIPGFGVDRINQAHYIGEIYEYPGGGPGLAMDTVEATLGVEVNYFVAVNFDGFTEFVDLIGGIDITVPETIDDPNYPDRCYGYDPFHIDAGQHHLDGQTALKYARTRATFGGDVDRAGRQQQVLLAVRDKILQLNMAPQLLAQSPQLWQAFQNNVQTNLTLEEVIQLALLAQDIPTSSIHTHVIDYNYVYNQTTPEGQQVLIPLRDKIRELRDQIFTPPMIPTPVIENLPLRIEEENARIAVYNGTPVFGLAGATQEYLLGLDLNIVEVGNADSALYRTTQIIDYGSHPGTTLYLSQIMAVPPLNISTGSKPAGDFDVLVIIGNDWRVPGWETPTP